MKTPAPHLSLFEGDLYDDRRPWGNNPQKADNVIRHRYEWHFGRINTLNQVRHLGPDLALGPGDIRFTLSQVTAPPSVSIALVKGFDK